MSDSTDDFLQRLRATFRIEADEHLQAITAGLMELEKTSSPVLQKPIIETIFRAAHSLKGAARAVELDDVESVCEQLEDSFARWKRQEAWPTPDTLDALHRRLDAISSLLGIAPADAAGGGPAAPAVVAVAQATPGHWATSAPQPAQEQGGASAGNSVRISVDLLDARLTEAEEMLAVKLAAGQRVDDLRELSQRLNAWRADLAGADAQARSLGERLATSAGPSPLRQLIDRGDEHLRSLGARVAALTRAAEHDRDTVGKLVDELLANSKQMLLLPFATISQSFPKLVRDLCRDQGKEADLSLEGEHTELDKRILDVLKDPLIHLLRNSVDHGVEKPAERARQGKPSRASIRLSVVQIAGGKVQIELADDGAGIDADAVRGAAIRRGVIAPSDAAALDEPAAQALVFRSDVSTSPIVTGVSGRGLGLAIVHEKAAHLGGEVSVDSLPGAGTTFRIIVPAVRATMRGILVDAAGRQLVVPTTQVERVARAQADDVKTVEGRQTITLEGRVLPLARLADMLELTEHRPGKAQSASFPVIVLGRGDERVAFVVDGVLDEQEILFKPLVRPLSRVRNIASATVLRDGTTALILHVGDLLKSARKPTRAFVAGGAQGKPAPRKSVLVAEDSITSRMLIKHTLESAGFEVETAVDGLDAFTRLRDGRFDVVVSDVEMPRLNGFDLTARIRADRALADTPVVLVTALESPQDRERGVDAGANAYIVKSNFEQSTLVDTVRGLA
ncbi:MAG TPA: response regulator [Ramlibacter sp.]|nr:response regulator [Ramlibacter sp.]